MAISQFRSRRKTTGGRYRNPRKKIKNRGDLPSLTTIGDLRKRKVRIRSGELKYGLLQINIVNLYDPKSKKYIKGKIETVIDSPSDRNFIRRNIMTKGSIIRTDKGNARIISRPGQEGAINAILIEK
ncbi:30S ribosomal protein S8e [Candidatus Woesearchaeota archaeon]|nr:30S ribosomal protein S8e [Candidatus Woesearchaeota archaeon]